MKKRHFLFYMSLAGSVLLSSCNFEDKNQDLIPSSQSNEYGTLLVNLSSDPSFAIVTRSVNEGNYKNTDNYTVRIINATTDNVLLECPASELSQHLPKSVEIGSYRVSAFYGAEHDANRNEFLMTGTTTVMVKSKEQKTVDVNCTPTCGKVSVTFDPSMSTYFSDYSVAFGGTELLGSNTFAWAKNDSEPWYVGVKEGGETITYTISLTAKEDYLHQGSNGNAATGTATGSFKLDRNKAHRLTVRPNYTPTTNGGVSVSISIDESTNDTEIDYEVPVTWL